MVSCLLLHLYCAACPLATGPRLCQRHETGLHHPVVDPHGCHAPGEEGGRVRAQQPGSKFENPLLDPSSIQVQASAGLPVV